MRTKGLVFVREIFLEIDGFKHAKDGENQQAGFKFTYLNQS
jgi:hypothetical protein